MGLFGRATRDRRSISYHVAKDLGAGITAVQAPGGLTSVISWRGVGAGFVTAVALALVLGAIARFSGLENNLGAAAALEFVALLAGGYVAGRLAGRLGVIQGVGVAVIFILIAASVKAWVEIDLAGRYGPQVLGPMDMGGLILGDLVHLLGASAGGWLADLVRPSPPAPLPQEERG
ncbi:MAG TPA: YrzE family protein [Chloroflexota bacterium]|nr:YrzE family protein [Chloroflexota bacterium]